MQGKDGQSYCTVLFHVVVDLNLVLERAPRAVLRLRGLEG